MGRGKKIWRRGKGGKRSTPLRGKEAVGGPRPSSGPLDRPKLVTEDVVGKFSD